MSKTNKLGQEPAHPVSEETTDRIQLGVEIYSGMSKRELIAKDTMCSLIASGWDDTKSTVKMALEFTDELLKELNNGQ